MTDVVYVITLVVFIATPVAGIQEQTLAPLVPCNFAGHTFSFSRRDGTPISPAEIRINHSNIECIDSGKWERPGNSSFGKPYRSPCQKMKDMGLKFPDVMVSDFWASTQDRLSYRFDFNESWEHYLFLRPEQIFLNRHLKCHPNDRRLVVIEDSDGESSVTIGIPLKYAIYGGDLSYVEDSIREVLLGIILFMVLSLIAFSTKFISALPFCIYYWVVTGKYDIHPLNFWEGNYDWLD